MAETLGEVLQSVMANMQNKARRPVDDIPAVGGLGFDPMNLAAAGGQLTPQAGIYGSGSTVNRQTLTPQDWKAALNYRRTF
jgi:hypothetical protein